MMQPTVTTALTSFFWLKPQNPNEIKINQAFGDASSALAEG
jgi:hypothetical protein